MPTFRKMLSGRSNARRAPIIQFAPCQSLTAGYFLLNVEPAIRHGLEELEDTNTRHAMTEVALMSYLMGMGFDFSTAKVIVESWERDDSLFAQGILTK